MTNEEKDIHIRLDGPTYQALVLMAEGRKRRGKKANISSLAREFLQQATGNIQGERAVKFRDLEYFAKQYDKGIDRLVKLWFRSSKLTLTMLMLFVNKMTKEVGAEKVQEMINMTKKQAEALLKKKEDEKGRIKD